MDEQIFRNIKVYEPKATYTSNRKKHTMKALFDQLKEMIFYVCHFSIFYANLRVFYREKKAGKR